MKNELASFGNCKDRLAALEEHRGTAASRKLDKRVSVLEDNYNTMSNNLSAKFAKCVTQEQFVAAGNFLAPSLHKTIQEHLDESDQRMASDVMLLNRRWGQHLCNIETSLKKVVQEHVFPVSTY